MAIQQPVSGEAPVLPVLRVVAVMLLGMAVIGAVIERFSLDGAALGLTLAAGIPLYFCIDYLRAQRRGR